MKHAIMVTGSGNDNSSVIQQTINVLDDPDIDFFIHWDKKYKLPNLSSTNSRVIFVPRIKVQWGTDTQTLAEIHLMQDVVNSCIDYDYVHLISSSDMPLMSVDYFKSFFKPNTAYLGFVDYLEDFKLKRIKYYYPIRYFNMRKNRRATWIFKICRLINKLFKINRLQNKTIEHGCNWFSMDIKYVKDILKLGNFNMFKNTFSSDEFYVQTALHNLKPKGLSNKYNYYSDNYRMSESSKMALRYIDWYRDFPYKFDFNDIDELRQHINTKYAFARKVSNADLIKTIFKDKYEK